MTDTAAMRKMLEDTKRKFADEDRERAAKIEPKRREFEARAAKLRAWVDGYRRSCGEAWAGIAKIVWNPNGLNWLAGYAEREPVGASCTIQVVGHNAPDTVGKSGPRYVVLLEPDGRYFLSFTSEDGFLESKVSAPLGHFPEEERDARMQAFLRRRLEDLVRQGRTRQ